jgi:hypothetical protein
VSSKSAWLGLARYTAMLVGALAWAGSASFAVASDEPQTPSESVVKEASADALSDDDEATKELASTLEGCKKRNLSNFNAMIEGHSDQFVRIRLAASPAAFLPPEYANSGKKATALGLVLIDSLGNARYPHVLGRITNDDVDRIERWVIQVLRKTEWFPARHAGQPISAWKPLRVTSPTNIVSVHGDKFLNEDWLSKLLASARAGDLKSREVAAYMNAMAPTEVGLTEVEQSEYLAAAVLAGSRSDGVLAAEDLGRFGCSLSPAVIKVVQRQAETGKAALGLMVAMELLEVADPSTYKAIGVLLHEAAKSEDPFAQVWATGLLATAPIAEIRDPAFALNRAMAFQEEGDPDFTEVLAAAQAAAGEFEDAVKTETRALNEAKALDWNDQQLRQRLNTYKGGKPWVGYLCDCTQLVPGEEFNSRFKAAGAR